MIALITRSPNRTSCFSTSTVTSSFGARPMAFCSHSMSSIEATRQGMPSITQLWMRRPRGSLESHHGRSVAGSRRVPPGTLTLQGRTRSVLRVEDEPPSAVILAGPNGAGKSTLASSLLVDVLRVSEFVDADVLARSVPRSETPAVPAAPCCVASTNWPRPGTASHSRQRWRVDRLPHEFGG